MDRTPPIFSKYREIREAGAGMSYKPQDFGLSEDAQWQHAPDFFEGQIGNTHTQTHNISLITLTFFFLPSIFSLQRSKATCWRSATGNTSEIKCRRVTVCRGRTSINRRCKHCQTFVTKPPPSRFCKTH